MPRDYYGVLGIGRNATPSEVRSAYRWASLKWHPQKNPSAKTEAEQRFRDIAEAYDVLVDPERRRTFDELGERGLKFPAPGSGIQPYQYVGDPFALFSTFFADSTPLAEAVAPAHDGMVPGASEKKAEASIEVEVVCSAAELKQGASRRFVVERTRLGPGGVPFHEAKPVSLPIRPGWSAGMRVTFWGEGNHTQPTKLPGDLVVVIKERQVPNNFGDDVQE